MFFNNEQIYSINNLAYLYFIFEHNLHTIIKCTCIIYLRISIRNRANRERFLYGIGCQKAYNTMQQKVYNSINIRKFSFLYCILLT